jgi:hypothetical protein
VASRVYRAAALERLSSPEQLDQLVHVARPRWWAALGILAALLVAALLWGWFGSISEEFAGGGVLQYRIPRTIVAGPNTQSEELEAVLLLPGDVYKKLAVGMEAHVLPVGLTGQEYGYILGRVCGLQAISRNGSPWTRVEVALERSLNSPSGYSWSLPHGPNWNLSSNTGITGKILTGRERPLSLLISRLRQ